MDAAAWCMDGDYDHRRRTHRWSTVAWKQFILQDDTDWPEYSTTDDAIESTGNDACNYSANSTSENCRFSHGESEASAVLRLPVRSYLQMHHTHGPNLVPSSPTSTSLRLLDMHEYPPPLCVSPTFLILRSVNGRAKPTQSPFPMLWKREGEWALYSEGLQSTSQCRGGIRGCCRLWCLTEQLWRCQWTERY